MKRVKHMIAWMLALVMCLSLAACGGKDAETTAPNETESPTAELEEKIFSDPYMEGVEHTGLAINADTATELQVQYAMAILNTEEHRQFEGYEYLYQTWLYAKMTFADGTYYIPITTSLPTAGDSDELYINGFNAVKAYHGRIGVATQLPVFQLSEEKIAELKQLDGWSELAESEIHLLYLLSDCLDTLGLSIESEGVQYAYGEVSAFAQCSYDTDEGPAATLFDLQIMDRDATGAYLCSITTVTGITTGTEEDGRTEFMDETDLAVLEEVMTYYNLYSWYD